MELCIMRDANWFRNMEEEYNEREDRLEEIRERMRQEKRNKESAWRKRQVEKKDEDDNTHPV
jgi:hypothetical protein